MSRFMFSEVLGNAQKLDGGSMFGNVPRALWSKWLPPDDLGRIPLECRAMLVEVETTAGKCKILFETGIGAFFEPKLAERFGVQTPDRHRLLENLKELGYSHEDIDYVILSHLHFDHAGGLLPTHQEISQGQEGLLFPNAKYIVGKEALARAENPHQRDRASFIPGLVDKLKASGRLLVVDGDVCKELLPDHLSFFRTSGHTPGQLHSVIRGNKSTVIFCGDLIPGRAWLHLPVTMGYDRFPEQLIDEKAELYKKAVADNWILYFTHDNEVAAATVQVDEKQKFTTNKVYSHPQRVEF